jgi:hypothetical protein
MHTFRVTKHIQITQKTTYNERLQSRNPQIIGAIHDQPSPWSENPWIQVAAPSAGDRPRHVAGVNSAYGVAVRWRKRHH